MDKRDCGNCKFWGDTVCNLGGKWYAVCTSDVANKNTIDSLRTTGAFGCLCWQKKEWTLKERLVKHLNMIKRLPHIAADSDTQADTIIEIVNSYMTGD